MWSGVHQAQEFGGTGPDWLLATAVLAVVLAAVALVDLRHFRIPDPASLSLIVAGLLLDVILPGTAAAPFWSRVVGAVAGFGVLAAIGEYFWRRTGTEGLGLGDAKLFAAAGAWLGWQSLPMVLLLASLAGLAGALLMRRRRIAFGPWIALAFLILWVAAAPVSP